MSSNQFFYSDPYVQSIIEHMDYLRRSKKLTIHEENSLTNEINARLHHLYLMESRNTEHDNNNVSNTVAVAGNPYDAYRIVTKPKDQYTWFINDIFTTPYADGLLNNTLASDGINLRGSTSPVYSVDAYTPVVIMGDSKSTVGKNWTTYLFDFLPVYPNHATSGWTVNNLKTNIDTYLSGKIDPNGIVLINIGVNDLAGTPEANFKNDYLYVLDAIHSSWPKSIIYCMRVWKQGSDAAAITYNGYINTIISQRSSFTFTGPDESIWLKGSDNGATNTTDGTHCSQAGLVECGTQWTNILPKLKTGNMSFLFNGSADSSSNPPLTYLTYPVTVPNNNGICAVYVGSNNVDCGGGVYFGIGDTISHCVGFQIRNQNLFRFPSNNGIVGVPPTTPYNYKIILIHNKSAGVVYAFMNNILLGMGGTFGANPNLMPFINNSGQVGTIKKIGIPSNFYYVPPSLIKDTFTTFPISNGLPSEISHDNNYSAGGNNITWNNIDNTWFLSGGKLTNSASLFRSNFLTFNSPTPDVSIYYKLNSVTTGSQTGVVLCCDNPSNPQNCCIVHYSQSNNLLYVEEYITGSRYPRISGSIVFSTDYVTNVTVRSGSIFVTARLGADIVQTSEVKLNSNVSSNKYHGLYCNGSGSKFTSIDVKACGTEGQYAILDTLTNIPF